MERRFYLAYVYDAEGYNRHDFVYYASLKDLDSYMGKFSNAEEVYDEFDFEENGRGKLHIVYEDIKVKREEISAYNNALKNGDYEHAERLMNEFSYAHIIPIMYGNEFLFSIEECYKLLRSKLNIPGIMKAIFFDTETEESKPKPYEQLEMTLPDDLYYGYRTINPGAYSKPKEVIHTNKRYIFEGEQEKDLIDTESDFRGAIDCFLKRFPKEEEEDQYFYCRTLVRICELAFNIGKTKNKGDRRKK